MLNDHLPRRRAVPLSAHAFALFGEVLCAPETLGAHACAKLGPSRAGMPPDLQLIHTAPAALPFRVSVMERHPQSSQSFLPLDMGRWLVLVAPRDAAGGPDMAAAQVFIAAPDQGVTYAADVWHHPLTVLDRPARIAILTWRDGTENDLELRNVRPFWVEA